MLSIRQNFWKLWYQYVSSRIGDEPVIFLNYGYWPAGGETLVLEPADESNRPAIQLYHHVAGGMSLAEKDVLEVSCGHGGGASFITRYCRPGSYTAIDQNPKAIASNRRVHDGLGIDFRVGDAQALDFPADRFDAVINIEASFCYPRQDAFFRSAHRVLRPDGHLLYADFRTPADTPQLDRDIEAAGFRVKSKTDITAHVVRALKRNSERHRSLAHRLVPRILHRAIENFAAVEGSSVYDGFVKGRRIYWSYVLVKAG
jgi:SAM-dependent methyltransferase